MNFVSRLLWSLPVIVAAYGLFSFVATLDPMAPVDQWLRRAIFFFAGTGSVLTITWLWLKPRPQTLVASIRGFQTPPWAYKEKGRTNRSGLFTQAR